MTSSPPDLAPYQRIGPAEPRRAVIVAVPHAGRDYDEALLAAARVSPDMLAALEDRHADLLAADAAAAGFTTFIARRPRAFIDLNRSERDIDPGMMSPPPSPGSIDDNARVRAGLGLVPRRGLGGMELWRAPIAADDMARRIADTHRPWHAAVAAALASARRRFGVAVLLDLHSMPSLRGDRGSPPAGIVIGDRHGASAARASRDRLSALARAAGLRAAENIPYAGGYSLDRHGRPAHSTHAVQLEIDRALYLASDLRRPGPGVRRIAALVCTMAEGLEDIALTDGLLAAE